MMMSFENNFKYARNQRSGMLRTSSSRSNTVFHFARPDWITSEEISVKSSMLRSYTYSPVVIHITHSTMSTLNQGERYLVDIFMRLEFMKRNKMKEGKRERKKFQICDCRRR